MKNLEFLEDLIKIVLPAGIVLYAMYLVVKSFLNKEFEKRLVELKLKNSETLLPIRLQAYERMALFLERVNPSSLLVRLNEPKLSAAQFQQLLIHEIREEFNHNVSQQIYMSDQAWRQIRSVKDSIINQINASAETLAPNARSFDLAQKIFEDLLAKKEDPVGPALVFLKAEIQKIF